MPGIRPLPTVYGITDHPDHTPIIPAGPRAKPPTLLPPARMTFSVGTTLYQVLALDAPTVNNPSPSAGEPLRLGQILRAMEHDR